MLPSLDLLHQVTRELLQRGQHRIVTNSYHRETNTTRKSHDHTTHTSHTRHKSQFMRYYLCITFLDRTCPIYAQHLICELSGLCSSAVAISSFLLFGATSLCTRYPTQRQHSCLIFKGQNVHEEWAASGCANAEGPVTSTCLTGRVKWNSQGAIWGPSCSSGQMELGEMEEGWGLSTTGHPQKSKTLTNSHTKTQWNNRPW
jgi:hypothetical protein